MHRTQRVTQTTDPAVAANAIARTHAAQAVDVDPGGAAFAFEERVRGTHLLSLETTACTGVVRGTIESDSAMVLLCRVPSSWWHSHARSPFSQPPTHSGVTPTVTPPHKRKLSASFTSL